ATVRLQAGNA
nr:Chain C, Nonstructural protein 9/10 [Severe acute respiratory syndrome coronavirus 2]7TA4_D Chain D, Nonstructural protein 9/10 [Severe acute respiratory syndrome coronavirus 2]